MSTSGPTDVSSRQLPGLRDCEKSAHLRPIGEPNRKQGDDPHRAGEQSSKRRCAYGRCQCLRHTAAERADSRLLRIRTQRHGVTSLTRSPSATMATCIVHPIHQNKNSNIFSTPFLSPLQPVLLSGIFSAWRTKSNEVWEAHLVVDHPAGCRGLLSY